MANSKKTSPAPEQGLEGGPLAVEILEGEAARRVAEAANRAVERIKASRKLSREKWAAGLAKDLAEFTD